MFNVATQVVATGLGFVVLRTTFQHLGGDALGLLALIISLNATIAGVLDLGLGATIVRDVAANAQASPQRVRSVLSSLALMYWGTYALTTIVVLLLIPALGSSWGRGSGLSHDTAIAAARVLAVGALLAIPRGLYSSVLQGLQRQASRNAVTLVLVVVQQAGTVLLLVDGAGLVAIAVWMTACAAASLLALIVLVARLLSVDAIRPSRRLSSLRVIWPFAGWTALVSVGGTVQTQADKVVVGKVLPLSDVGYYGAVTSLLGAGQVATSAVADVALPALSTPAVDAAYRRLQVQRLQALHAVGVAPLFAGVAMTEPAVFTFLFSPSVAQTLWVPVMLLALGYYLNAGLTVPYLLSLAQGHPEIAAQTNLFELVIVFPAIVVLSIHLGLVGTSLSWIMYSTVEYVYMLPHIGRTCLGMSVAQTLRTAVIPQLIAMVVYGGASVGLFVMGVTSFPRLCAAYVVATAIYAAVSLLASRAELRDAMRLVVGR